jgi:hypothetical protein
LQHRIALHCTSWRKSRAQSGVGFAPVPHPFPPSLAPRGLSRVEAHYTLKQAAAKFFPDGQLTVASLRGEIRKGRLQATMPAGKLLITESAIAAMLEACRCRAVVNHPAFGSDQQTGTGRPRGSSLTERSTSARDAANATLSKLSASSRTTSRPNSNHRRAGRRCHHSQKFRAAQEGIFKVAMGVEEGAEATL